MIREVIVEPNMDAVNFALLDQQIDPEQIISIIRVDGNYIAAVPGGGPKYHVVYRERNKQRKA